MLSNTRVPSKTKKLFKTLNVWPELNDKGKWQPRLNFGMEPTYNFGIKCVDKIFPMLKKRKKFRNIPELMNIHVSVTNEAHTVAQTYIQHVKHPWGYQSVTTDPGVIEVKTPVCRPNEWKKWYKNYKSMEKYLSELEIIPSSKGDEFYEGGGHINLDLFCPIEFGNEIELKMLPAFMAVIFKLTNLYPALNWACLAANDNETSKAYATHLLDEAILNCMELKDYIAETHQDGVKASDSVILSAIETALNTQYPSYNHSIQQKINNLPCADIDAKRYGFDESEREKYMVLEFRMFAMASSKKELKQNIRLAENIFLKAVEIASDKNKTNKLFSIQKKELDLYTKDEALKNLNDALTFFNVTDEDHIRRMTNTLNKRLQWENWKDMLV